VQKYTFIPVNETNSVLILGETVLQLPKVINVLVVIIREASKSFSRSFARSVFSHVAGQLHDYVNESS
jgi:hypothetical protein